MRQERALTPEEKSCSCNFTPHFGHFALSLHSAVPDFYYFAKWIKMSKRFVGTALC